jgi:hypothetical protein
MRNRAKERQPEQNGAIDRDRKVKDRHVCDEWDQAADQHQAQVLF